MYKRLPPPSALFVVAEQTGPPTSQYRTYHNIVKLAGVDRSS